jgi:type VI secretion system protein ImpH
MADPIGIAANGLELVVGQEGAASEQPGEPRPAMPERPMLEQPTAERSTAEQSAAESVTAEHATAEPATAERRKAEHAMAAQLLDMFARAPHEFDFFQLLRRLECAYRDRPRLGQSAKAAEEPIRLGQEASTVFAPAPLAGLRPGRAGTPPWLLVNFMGLLGPNGPLALHLTEYARDRLRNSGDSTFVRFLDLFHHRMLLLFYRAWANGRPAVSHDRPEEDRFLTYLGTIVGLALPSFRDRDAFPHAAKLFYSGLLGAQTHNAEGLSSMVGDFFGMPARIEQFVGSWLKLPAENRWALGRSAPSPLLGLSTTLGEYAWGRQQKFRVVLGPLSREQFRQMLPGGTSLPRLAAMVRNYIGDELRWDVRLYHEEKVDEPLHLGRSRLGWTAWLGRAAASRREELILDPQAESEAKAA